MGTILRVRPRPPQKKALYTRLLVFVDDFDDCFRVIKKKPRTKKCLDDNNRDKNPTTLLAIKIDETKSQRVVVVL